MAYRTISNTDIESNGMGTKEDHGVIYIMTCLATSKSYVGQAVNYTSCGVKYSGKGRMQVHFRDAFDEKRASHCRLVNDAIRTYGLRSIIWTNIREVPERDLNKWEKHDIKSFGTLHPNGYNLTKGGEQLNVSNKRKKELIEKLRKKTLLKCPKYVFPIMKQLHVVGFYVEGYPDGTGGTYPRKDFNDITHNDRNCRAAGKYVKYLEMLNKNKNFDDRKYAVCDSLKKTINPQTGLPKYIYRVNFQGEQIGYAIVGFKKADGTVCSRKFNNAKIPMEEKYNLILAYLEKLINDNKTI